VSGLFSNIILLIKFSLGKLLAWGSQVDCKTVCNFSGLCDGIQCWFRDVGILYSNKVCVCDFPVVTSPYTPAPLTANVTWPSPRPVPTHFNFTPSSSNVEAFRWCQKGILFCYNNSACAFQPVDEISVWFLLCLGWFSTPLPNPSPVFPLLRTHSKSPCVPSRLRTTKFSNKANP